jgi:TATA-binding protein-associated factor Taf7
MQLLCNKPKGEEKLVGGDEGGEEQDEEEENLLEEVEEDRREEEPEPEPPQLVSFSVSPLADTTSLSKHCPITQN